MINYLKIAYLLFIFLALSPNLASADSIPEGSYYDVSCRLELTPLDEDVFWGLKEIFDWVQEKQNWKFAVLLEDDNLLPLVIYEDQTEAYQSDKANTQKDYYEIYDNAEITVINPSAKVMVTNYTFFLQSYYRRKQKLYVYINGDAPREISLSRKDIGFEAFTFKDVVFLPGKNTVRFSCKPKITGTRKNIFNFWHNRKNKLFIRLKDDAFFEVKETKAADNSTPLPQVISTFNEKGLSFLIYFPKVQRNLQFFLMSRDIDIDLNEYPYFDFYYEFKSSIWSRSDVFLGVDSNNDGKIDYCLNPQNLGSVNLLDLARKKEKARATHSNTFILRKVFVVSRSGGSDTQDVESKTEREIYDRNFQVFTIKNFRFYSKKAITLPVKSDMQLDFKVSKTNCKNYNTFFDKNILILSLHSFTNRKEQNFRLDQDARSSPQTDKKDTLDDVFVELSFPIDSITNHNNGSENYYLTFLSAVTDQDLQKIDVFLGIKDAEAGVSERMIALMDTQATNLEVRDGFYKREIYLGEQAKKARSIVLRLSKKKKDIGHDDWFHFYIKDMRIYKKYPLTVTNQKLQENILAELRNMAIPLFSIDGRKLSFSQIKNQDWSIFGDETAHLGDFKISKGKHKIKIIKNDVFKVKWVKLEPLDKPKGASVTAQEPKIIFKKINQTKYIVQVKGATAPFWLTFLETFHPQWKLYLSKEAEDISDIIKDYEGMGVKEARYSLKVNLSDFKYFFRKPLPVDNQHFRTNFYANSWYIEPKKLGLPENFTLALYFLPQSLFYIGLIISGSVLIICILYLFFRLFIKRNNK